MLSIWSRPWSSRSHLKVLLHHWIVRLVLDQLEHPLACHPRGHGIDSQNALHVLLRSALKVDEVIKELPGLVCGEMRQARGPSQVRVVAVCQETVEVVHVVWPEADDLRLLSYGLAFGAASAGRGRRGWASIEPVGDAGAVEDVSAGKADGADIVVVAIGVQAD